MNKKAFFHKHWSLWAFLLITISFTSCRSSREAQGDRNIPNRKTSEILDSLHSQELTCDWLSIKYQIEVKSPDFNDSFKMYLRMKRDSAIWVSATYYSVEVARFLLTPDSVKYMDRRNNQYYVGGYDYITERFKIEANFNLLQSLILANGLALETIEGEKVRSSKDQGKYLLSYLRKGQLRRAIRNDELKKELDLVISMWVEPENFRVGKMSISDFDINRSLTAEYSEFKPECNSEFPYATTYTIDNANEQFEVKTSVMKVSADKEVSLSFTIPDKYEPVAP